ncbi:hypothetical protein J6590_053278 [Homalodisca vitripennis]|nr:hypothetical protein J6590_053278 [Homalodisca vitripennis]
MTGYSGWVRLGNRGPPVEIHEEELNLKVMSFRKKGKPALNQPLQSKQTGGDTSLLRLARTSEFTQGGVNPFAPLSQYPHHCSAHTFQLHS